jgi:hypothetical protein
MALYETEQTFQPNKYRVVQEYPRRYTRCAEYFIDRLGSESAKPIVVDLNIVGRPLKMKLDTGAAFFIISDSTCKANYADVKLRPLAFS